MHTHAHGPKSFNIRLPKLLFLFCASELARLSVIGSGFNLNQNQFSRSIPSEFGALTNMKKSFEFSWNELSGTLPSELGQLTAMTSRFSFEGNHLQGSLPSEVGRLSAMESGFTLSSPVVGNSFTGAIPSELGALSLFVGSSSGATSAYHGLSLSENSFTGSVPSQLSKLTGMTGYFSLFNNQLCGEVPQALAALSSQMASWRVEEGNDGLLNGACPTEAPTAAPVTSPFPVPTSKPVFAPSRAPTPPPPTALPTVSAPPSHIPTSAPSAVPDPLVYHSGTGLIELASGSTVRLGLSGPSEVLRLSWVSSSGLEDRAAGRSYGGHDWEGVQPLALSFDCAILRNGAGCTVTIPEATAAGGGYYLTSFNDTSSRSARALASRFLTVATFGPTRDSITDFVDRHGGNAEAWVREQMSVEPSLHRAYFRQRANPRLSVDTETMAVRHPCAKGSRWNRFALTAADVGRTASLTAVTGAASYLSLSVDGVVRTEVDVASSVWDVVALAEYASNGTSQFTVCAVEEVRGGAVTMGLGCGASVVNPAVAFYAGAPASDRVLLDGGGFTDLADYRPGNTFDQYRYDPPAESDVVILDGDEAACIEDSGAGDTIFAVTTTSAGSREVLIHDRRAALLENTLEAPATESLGVGSCPSVPKTFLNLDSCVPSSGGCSTVVYTSKVVTLNETTVKMFYDLGGTYVYYIQGLCMDDVETPCTSETSRWVKQDDESACAAAEASGVVDADTVAVLSAALRDDSGSLAFLFGATANAKVRDIVIANGACSGGSEVVSTALTVTESDGSSGCWQHVHSNEFSLFDFTYWTTAHPGNAFALDGGRPNPITAFALAGKPYITFPSCTWHPMSRWLTGLDDLEHIGRLGDVLDFASLPTSVQSDAMARAVGAVGSRAADGFETCGSPGEVANDPNLRQLQYINTYDGINSGAAATQMLDGHDTSVYRGKYLAFSNTAHMASDQLRQRVAWALSQIFVVNSDSINSEDETELYVTYYDIFVRNAFGNYLDIMRLVALFLDVWQHQACC